MVSTYPRSHEASECSNCHQASIFANLSYLIHPVMIHTASFLGWKLLMLLLLALMASSNNFRSINKGRLRTILRCWDIRHLICNLISLLSLLALMVSSDDQRHVSKGRLCTILYCWNICHLICNLISHCSQFAFLDFVASLNIGASIVL